MVVAKLSLVFFSADLPIGEGRNPRVVQPAAHSRGRTPRGSFTLLSIAAWDGRQRIITSESGANTPSMLVSPPFVVLTVPRRVILRRCLSDFFGLWCVRAQPNALPSSL